jgi:hypothetical protein
MITAERLTGSAAQDPCDAYECTNNADVLIGGLQQEYDGDISLCLDDARTLVDKLMEVLNDA